MGSLHSEHATWLHRIPAGIKLLCLGLLGSALWVVTTPVPMLAITCVCALLWFSLGPATTAARRLLLSVLLGAACIATFHAWMGRSDLAITSSLRLACASTLGVAFTVTTAPSHILALLERLLTPLERAGLPAQRWALQLALMLRFIEHFFVQWKRLDDAHRLRTGKAGGVRLLAPLSIHMLQTAKRVADALFARLGQ